MESPIRDFRDLFVWRKAVAFAKAVYTLTDRFPDAEKFGLTAQLRRAAVSVSSNIAEGHARQGREFQRFLSMAVGSTAEVVSQLLLAVELGMLSSAETATAESLATEVRKMCAALLKRLR